MIRGYVTGTPSDATAPTRRPAGSPDAPFVRHPTPPPRGHGGVRPRATRLLPPPGFSGRFFRLIPGRPRPIPARRVPRRFPRSRGPFREVPFTEKTRRSRQIPRVFRIPDPLRPIRTRVALIRVAGGPARCRPANCLSDHSNARIRPKTRSPSRPSSRRARFPAPAPNAGPGAPTFQRQTSRPPPRGPRGRATRPKTVFRVQSHSGRRSSAAPHPDGPASGDPAQGPAPSRPSLKAPFIRPFPPLPAAPVRS